MQRNIPIELLCTLENWFHNCWTCVKWRDSTSSFFQIKLGVRQGSVLSPTLFAVYINDIIGKSVIGKRAYIILYADDILIVSTSLCELQDLLRKCEFELKWLNMSINAKKSCCMRIGPHCDVKCANITTTEGHILSWVDEIRYLGVFLVKSRVFKCSFSYAKRSFYRALNAVFGKVGRVASVPVLLELVSSKCLPILLYGLEACPTNKADRNSMDFAINRFMMKLLKTGNIDIVEECMFYFNFQSVSMRIAARTVNFAKRFAACPNTICQMSLVL